MLEEDQRDMNVKNFMPFWFIDALLLIFTSRRHSSDGKSRGRWISVWCLTSILFRDVSRMRVKFTKIVSLLFIWHLSHSPSHLLHLVSSSTLTCFKYDVCYYDNVNDDDDDDDCYINDTEDETTKWWLNLQVNNFSFIPVTLTSTSKCGVFYMTYFRLMAHGPQH